MARYNSGNPYYTAVENTLEQYVPMPFQEMLQASQAIQQRGDAIHDKQAATDSMLANIEALAPEHKSYINNLANTFRTTQTELLDKYNGDASNPEFIRESRNNIIRTASDPNFRTVLSANEKLKMNDKIAREMAAKGQLFIKPEFNGINPDGTLSDNVGSVDLVNTLDKLKEEYQIAWQSMENDNKGTITNKANIDRQNKRVLDAISNNSPEFARLATAYMQQGLTEEQAKQRIQSDITGLQGQFGIKKERDNSYFQYQLALRNDARQSQEHALRMAKLKSELIGGENSPDIPKGTILNGIVSKQDINKDKFDIVSKMKSYLDKNGNLERKKIIGETTYSTDGGGVLGVRKHSNMTKESVDKAATKAVEALAMMRTELGWPKSGKNSGSAKQVIEAYENFIKNDNLISSAYVPSNSTVFNGLEKTFGSHLEAADTYINGKKDVLKASEMADVMNNAKFAGISVSNGGIAIFNSVSSDDKKKAITLTVPLDAATKSALDSNLKFAKIIDNFRSNTDLEKELKTNGLSYLMKDGSGNIYAPRKTSNGLRYAQATVDENGNFIEFKRNGANGLNYLNDNILQRQMNKEYSGLDEYLEYKYK